MNGGVSKPWLKSPAFDLTFLLAPAFVSVFVAFVFARGLGHSTGVPLWAWLVFIVGIDVAHVYSTLFRTYFNAGERRENQALLALIPLGVWCLGVGLYAAGPLVFWRTLTYVAVFHFIRQQYGFLRLYCRNESESKLDRWLSSGAIYLTTFYPMAYWHAHQPRNFHWFIEGDLFTGLPVWVSDVMGWFSMVVLVLYFGNEALKVYRGRSWNLPKNLVVLGTALSWYVGIVQFNGDLIFTITNVVSHGIPYLALVWLYGERQKNAPNSPPIYGKISYAWFFSRRSIPLYIGLLLVFAFFEEGLWAGLVWREHLEVFGVFRELPEITARDTLAWLVPLLTLPQATHYVLDGFIWKIQDTNANWQKVLFSRSAG